MVSFVEAAAITGRYSRPMPVARQVVHCLAHLQVILETERKSLDVRKSHSCRGCVCSVGAAKQSQHGVADTHTMQAAGGSKRVVDFSTETLWKAATNARCCVQELADMRANGTDTVGCHVMW